MTVFGEVLSFIFGGATLYGGLHAMTSPLWHRLFHRNHARELLRGRVVCTLCVHDYTDIMEELEEL
jgi:hypothetical protein